jgi:hypothetical protein
MEETKFSDLGFRPSLMSQLDGISFGIISLILAVPISLFAAEALQSEKMLILSIPLIMFGLFSLCRAGWRCINKRLCLCNVYLSLYDGLFAADLRITRVLYEHIRGVEIKQSLTQRVFNLGDLYIGTDISRGEGDIIICGVANPERVKDEVISRARIRTAGNSMAATS